MQYAEALEQFTLLFEHQLSDEEARALLVDLYTRGESADEIAAAATVMRNHSIRLELPGAIEDKIIDIVGTGGDQSGSFNISSTASFILAACGCYVAKHGNRSITSRSGSADVLEALGIKLDLSPSQQRTMLESTGFTFMFAIHHHPAMKHIMPIRKSLPHRTIFNILGPLTNPAGAKKQLIGVFGIDYIERLSEALRRLGAHHVMVVSSEDGLDEISICAPTHVAHLKEGTITKSVIDPASFGFSCAEREEILGGDANDNARITLGLLEGSLEGPKKEILLLNAAAALMVDGKAKEMTEGIALAQEAISSGRALQKLRQIAEFSHRF